MLCIVTVDVFIVTVHVCIVTVHVMYCDGVYYVLRQYMFVLL